MYHCCPRLQWKAGLARCIPVLPVYLGLNEAVCPAPPETEGKRARYTEGFKCCTCFVLVSRYENSQGLGCGNQILLCSGALKSLALLPRSRAAVLAFPVLQ